MIVARHALESSSSNSKKNCCDCFKSVVSNECVFSGLLAGSSGDESDSSRGVPSSLEVPPGLQVIPLNHHLHNSHHSHNGGGGSALDELAHQERLKVRLNLDSQPSELLTTFFLPGLQQLQSAEQFLLQMARLQRPPPDLDIHQGSVVANKPIPKGTQYGPFLGKFFRESLDRREVSVVSFLKKKIAFKKDEVQTHNAKICSNFELFDQNYIENSKLS